MKNLRLLGCVILLAIARPLGGLAAPLIAPPFVRQWTALVGDQAAVIAVRAGLIYYQSQHGVGALDLRTGERRWSSLSKRWFNNAIMRDGVIYAAAQTDSTHEIAAINVATHQVRNLARLPGEPDKLALDEQHVYVLDNAARLRAYNLHSGALVWSRQLQAGQEGGINLSQLIATPAGLYVAFGDSGEFGVDAKTGVVRWQHQSQYASTFRPLIVGDDVITQYDRLKRIHLRNGAVVWRGEQAAGGSTVVGNVVVCDAQDDLVGCDAATGHTLWRLPLRDKGVTYTSVEEQPIVTDGESVWMIRQPVVCVTKQGHEKWRHAHPFTGLPAYADSQHVVTCDQERILCYGAGDLSPLPTSDAERRTLAERLAAQFELLDDAERQQLTQLSPYSFQPLLARTIVWANDQDAKSQAATVEGTGDYMSYSLLQDALPLLYETCRQEDTPAILDALSKLSEKSDWRGRLQQILQAKGDPAAYVPVLVDELRRLPLKQREPSAALDAVAHSSAPQAVALMLEALHDPKAAPAWREAAFQHLAGTGGEAGVAAVQAARVKRQTVVPWFELIDPTKLGKNEIVSTKHDALGRLWVLFYSAVLGNGSDLFIVQREGTKWGKPIFTGAWTERTFRSPAPTMFRSIPIGKLITTEWIKIFPIDPTLLQDSDHDGLSDLVEARLGTDPHKADTDGDRVSDLIDPCPNAAPRALDDSEKIIAACVEARFFEQHWHTPAIISAEGIKPFELYGYAAPVLWQIGQRQTPLGQLYGGGVNLINFHSDVEGQRQRQPFIRYSDDHKTAYTVISRYSGGLNGDGIEVTLKKIGADWFAVDLRELYVS